MPRLGAVPCPIWKNPAALPVAPVVTEPAVLILSLLSTVIPVTVGEDPAPPPFISVLTVHAADDAHVLALPKYGMPPLVPATVNAGVVVGLATDIKPPVKLTDVTVPLPPPPPLFNCCVHVFVAVQN